MGAFIDKQFILSECIHTNIHILNLHISRYSFKLSMKLYKYDQIYNDMLCNRCMSFVDLLHL